MHLLAGNYFLCKKVEAMDVEQGYGWRNKIRKKKIPNMVVGRQAKRDANYQAEMS